MQDYIPLDQCKDGFLYMISARNAALGIFKSQTKSFVISRHKWGKNYLFHEYHYETGAPFGTAKPLEELGATNLSTDSEIMSFLNDHPLYNDAKEKGIRAMFKDAGIELTEEKLKLLMIHEH